VAVPEVTARDAPRVTFAEFAITHPSPHQLTPTHCRCRRKELAMRTVLPRIAFLALPLVLL